jgi:ATP-binding cassette, subfamily B, bacterial PglK
MINKIVNILSFCKQKSLISILFYSLILIITEIISVALLFPLLVIVFKKENIFLQKFNSFLLEYDLIFFNFFITFSILILLIFIARFFIASGLTFIVVDYKATVQKFFSKIALSRYLEGSYLDFKNENSNQFSVLVSRETEKFANAVDALIKIFTDGLILLTFLLFLFYKNLMVSIYLLLILIIIFTFNKFVFNPSLKKWGDRHIHHDIKRITTLNEIFNLIREIRIFSQTAQFIKKFSFDNSRTQIAQRNRLFFSQLLRNFIELILVISIILILIFTNFTNKDISEFFPLLSFFFLALIRLLPSVLRILSGIQTIIFSERTVLFHEQLIRFYKRKKNAPKKISGKKNYFEAKNKNFIKFQNLSFKYGNNSIIKNLNNKFNDSLIIGIKGQSGSGKTTLIEILLGLLKPSSGKIYFNNHDISKNLLNWTKQVSYISQDNNLFSGSIAQNIAFELDESLIESHQIKTLLKKININFYKKFQNKLNKQISYNSRNLSGGEKQRISIARGLFRGKKIIILDEVTSSLDLKNSNEIMNELIKFKKDKIIILISHKDSSLKFCDEIYELKDLKLVKQVGKK